MPKEKRNRKSLDLEKLNEENINDNEIEVPLIKNPIEQDEKSLENYPSEYKASPFKTSSFDPKKTFNTSSNVNSSSPYSNQILQEPLVEKEEIKNDEPEEKSPINLSAHNDNPFIADEINYTDKTNIKVVKNKVAPPFKTATVDIMYGEGVSKEGELLDLASDAGIVEKSGAWYAYKGDKIGQGKENAKIYLKENSKIENEIEELVRKHYNISLNKKVEKEAKTKESK